MRRKLPGRPSGSRGRGRAGRSGTGAPGAAPGKKKKKERPPPRSRRPSATSRSWSAAARWKVEGVGLVTGLDNTGGDSPPSWYRKNSSTR